MLYTYIHAFCMSYFGTCTDAHMRAIMREYYLHTQVTM